MSFTKKRIIEIFIILLDSKKMTTKDIAEKYNVSQRTAQRDIRDVADALETLFPNKKLQRDSSDYTYYLDHIYGLDNKNLLIILKVLLSSRALNSAETSELVNQLLLDQPENDSKMLKNSILNELTFITSIYDTQNRADKVWHLEKMIQEYYLINFNYTDYELFDEPITSPVTLQPTSIFFDNYYFFLVGLEIQSQEYFTYRIDWMEDITSKNEKEKIDRSSRYEHGLKRPVTAYAYPGKKVIIQFEYYGFIDYVMDRFPSCRVIKKLDKQSEWGFAVHLLQIEVEYSWGVKIWLLGDSGNIRVTMPKEIVNDIKETLLKTYQRYN